MGSASIARRANVGRTPIWCAPMLLLSLAMPARAEIQGQTVGLNALTDMRGVNVDASGPASLIAEKRAAEDAAAFLPVIVIDVVAAGQFQDAWDDDMLVRRILSEAAFRPPSEEDRPIAS